jgi:hypothetical protein
LGEEMVFDIDLRTRKRTERAILFRDAPERYCLVFRWVVLFRERASVGCPQEDIVASYWLMASIGITIS